MAPLIQLTCSLAGQHTPTCCAVYIELASPTLSLLEQRGHGPWQPLPQAEGVKVTYWVPDSAERSPAEHDEKPEVR